MTRTLTLLLCLAAALHCAELPDAKSTPADAFLRAIRANDLKTLQEISRTGLADVKDRLDWTPLHFAALYGSTDSVRMLLAAGANPNARNSSQATPLMYAAYSLEKTRVLVEKGGDVNAKTSDGSTPLWVAAGVSGNTETIRYLIARGADPKVIGVNEVDLLMRSASFQDEETVHFLLEKGLDPRRVTKGGTTALNASITCDRGEKARLLIAAGSDVNVANKDAGTVKNGPIESTGVTPLMDAAACGEIETTKVLLKAGANVNALDNRHMSPLMMAVAVDVANPAIVRQLIMAGADVNVPDRFGDTALDWARRYGNPAILTILEKAGAKGKGLSAVPARPADYKPDAKTAIDRASALLAKSNEEFFREGGGCVGCHHQPFAGRAFGAVAAAGLSAEPRLRQILLDGMVAERARETNRLPLMNAGGGGFISFIYPLAGMADMGEPASTLTDVMVHYIAENQTPTGAWLDPSSRDPLSGSGITQTMLAVYALKTYGWPARQPEFHERIARARNWLASAPARTNVEEADRLMGLWLAGAEKAELQTVAAKLLKLQRPDGGWAQNPNMDSDAYGTASALYSLRKAGFLAPDNPVYQRGAQFLLNTQYPDGSWYVRSRAVKLQPYFQSAFPFDHDQWISNTSTAYAVMALAPLAGH